MFMHKKRLMYTMRVEAPDPRLASLMPEQFGGPDGELAAAMLIDIATEHYEISRYGTLIAWAEQLGLTDAIPLLEETLAEERRTDVLLSKLALSQVNAEAA